MMYITCTGDHLACDLICDIASGGKSKEVIAFLGNTDVLIR